MVSLETTTAPRPLTPKTVERLPPGEYRDTGAPGLQLRVSASGARSFRASFIVGGKQVWVRLGRVSLGEARRELEKLQDARKAGKLAEAIGALKPKLTSEPAGGALTVRAAAKEFLAHLEVRRRRPEQARDIFRRDLTGTDEAPKPFGALLMRQVSKADINGVIRPIVARGSPVAAGATLRLLRQFFTWASDYWDDLPTPGIPKLETVNARMADESERYLSPPEIIDFWKATAGLDPVIKCGLRLLLMLGVRSGELRQATWSEVDLDAATWVVPPEHQKSHLAGKKKKPAKPFAVPLPDGAVAVFRELRALADSIGSPWVLPSFRKRGQAISEKALIASMRSLFEGEPPALKFEGERPTPHSLRKTTRTHLEETLHFDEATCERVLNHRRGAMVEAYMHGPLFEARKAALQAWAEYLGRLVADGRAPVIPMPARTARP